MIVNFPSELIMQHPFVAGVAGVSAGAALAIWYGVLYSGSNVVAPVIKTIYPHKAVALTFDDGPTPGFTDRVLDILRQQHAHASFFLIGSQVKQYPELVHRMIADGVSLGKHSLNQFGMPFDLRSNEKKTGVGIVLPQYIKHPIGESEGRAVVKGKCYGPVRMNGLNYRRHNPTA